MSRLRRLRQLWRQIPTVECKGLCWDSCGPISSSLLEAGLVRQSAGRGFDVEPHPLMDGSPMCCHLSAEGRCQVYELRPTICRVWGIVEGLPCHHGCKPARTLTDHEGFLLIAKSLAIGGDDQPGVERLAEQLEAALADGSVEVRFSNVPGRTTVTMLDHRPLLPSRAGGKPAPRLPN